MLHGWERTEYAFRGGKGYIYYAERAIMGTTMGTTD